MQHLPAPASAGEDHRVRFGRFINCFALGPKNVHQPWALWPDWVHAGVASDVSLY